MITETCKIFYFKLTKLRNLRSFLSYDHKIILVKTFIISRIDYCNSLYACLPHYLLRRLERLLNACIRFIFNISIFNHNLLSYYFNSLILPIEYRIKYKLRLTVDEILNNLSPKYLTNLVIVHIKPLKKNLRSGKDNWIINTRHHISFAPRWFIKRFPKTRAFLFKKTRKKFALSLLSTFASFVERAIQSLYHLKACFFVIKTM